MRSLFLHMLLCVLPFVAAAQAQPGVRELPSEVRNGDTLATFLLASTRVNAGLGEAGKERMKEYQRMVFRVRKVYPYALLTKRLLEEYEHDLDTITSDKDKKLYIKLAEAELRAELEDSLKNLSVNQGRVLMKLIERETGQTTYDLVKEMRGGFRAWIYQGVAKLFGNDMKVVYDPTSGEDYMIETIVHRIEQGEFHCIPLAPSTPEARARLERRKDRLYRKYGVEVPGTASATIAP